MPTKLSSLAATQLPAALALVRLTDGSALARAIPAWALSPTGKIDFRSEDDMLDLLDAACDDAEKTAPGLDMSSGSVYGFVQGSRKIAVATLTSEPMEWAQAKRLMEGFPDSRHASGLLHIASVEAGVYPLPRERALRLIPGLELALTELDYLGQVRHSIMGGRGPKDPPEVTQEQIRQFGLARMKDQLNREREERLQALKERRELIKELNALDPSKAPLVIFVSEMSYAIEGVDTMDELRMTHALAIPLSDLAGKEWSLPERTRPERLPEIASMALEKAQEAWGEFPNAQKSCPMPASAQCLVIDQRLAVAIPIDPKGYPVFRQGSDMDREGSQAALRQAAWVAGIAERVAVSTELRVDGPRASRALALALQKDERFWAEVGAIDLALSTPAASKERTPGSTRAI